MKKIILTAIVAVAAMGAQAQVWVGGSLGFNYDKAKIGGGDVKVTTLSIAPEVGYNLDENWALAIALQESNTSMKDGDGVNQFSVNPYVRYTFAKTGNVSFFLDGGFNVGIADGVITNGLPVESDDDATTWGIGVRPGVKFACNKKISLVAILGGLGYQHTKCGALKEDQFGFNADNNALKFGIYYNF